MTPNPDTSPPSFTLHVDAPDTPEDREWLTGWCLCHGQPLVDGQLLPDPWIWPSLGATDGAWRVTGPWPGRLRMTRDDLWIVDVHGRPPVQAGLSEAAGAFRYTLTIGGPFWAHAWVHDDLLSALNLLRFIRPGYRVSADDPSVLDPLLSATNKELLASSSGTLYWRICRYRNELRRAPTAQVLERDKLWLDGTVRTMIAEELRHGLLHPRAVRSNHVDMLEVLHTPAGRLSLWERRH